MTMAHRRADLLEDMVSHTIQRLLDCGIPMSIAEQIAAGLADHFAEHWAGQVLSFPKDYAYKLAQRDRDVLAASRTMSIAALASHFGFTERGIRLLLKRAKRRDVVDDQISLF